MISGSFSTIIFTWSHILAVIDLLHAISYVIINQIENSENGQEFDIRYSNRSIKLSYFSSSTPNWTMLELLLRNSLARRKCSVWHKSTSGPSLINKIVSTCHSSYFYDHQNTYVRSGWPYLDCLIIFFLL